MIDFSRVKNYYIRCGYTDMRKQIDGLVALVQLEYRQEMNEESLFLFCGCRSYRIKALYWDGTGHVLLYKRLSEKRPMAAEPGGTETVDTAGVPVAHGRSVHRANKGL